MNVRRFATRRIRRFGASLPGPVKSTIRRSLKRFVPEPAAQETSLLTPAPAVEHSPLSAQAEESSTQNEPVSKPPSRRGSERYIPLNASGTTYSPEEASTFLQMEAAHLRNILIRRRAGQGDSEPASAEADSSTALADHYLRQQEGHHRSAPADRIKHLVLVSAYPRNGGEYGNGFVHQRIKYYQAAGAEVHVAVVASGAGNEIYTYDGVQVITGQGAEARHLLRQTQYGSISTHFLVPYLWDQVKVALGHQKLHCFVHGFEARRWIRTLYNYRDQQAVLDAIEDTVRRQGMWREVLGHPDGPRRYIFVSDWWRRAAQEDMEVVFPGARTEIVHNVIDGQLFRYSPKEIEQRFRILWVRSANNLNYGSDLAVRVLEALRETPYWNKIQVTIVGDGRHFDAFENAFAEDENVTIYRCFILREEIARLHRDHGIFLVPTRLDSQGVSRDEAMASGMVPVTNRVAAVGEFVDKSCSVLCDPEDVDGMVAGILRLIDHPEVFTAMSRAASERVLKQSAPQATVRREMELMGMIAASDPSDSMARRS